MTTGDLTRPIVGIENRTAAEVFDIMCDRIRLAREAGAQEPVAVPAGWDALDASIASLKAQHAAFASAIAEFEHAVMTIIVNVRRKPACTPDELEKWWYDEKLPRIRAMLAAAPVSPPAENADHDQHGHMRLLELTKPEERSKPFLIMRACYRAMVDHVRKGGA